MADARDNLVLDLQRAIRAGVAELKADMSEVKERLGFIEAGYASISRRVDRAAGDVGHIKKRLGLIDA